MPTKLLIEKANQIPNQIALEYGSQTWTFQALFLLSKTYAQKLSTLNIQSGDRVAFLCNNHPTFVFLLHACQLLNVQAVLLNTRLTHEEIIYQYQTSESVCILADSDLIQQLNLQTSLPVYSIQSIEQLDEKEINISPDFNPDDIATILFTSGTTSKPKAVIHTYRNHIASAEAAKRLLDIQEKDSWLTVLPIYHIGGYSILIRSLLTGCRVVLLDKFEPMKVIQHIESGVEFASFVSTMVERIFKEKENINHSLKAVLVGGGPVHQSLLREGIRRNIPLLQTYGMTETASQVATIRPEESLKRIGSAGKAIPPFELRIKNHWGQIGSPMEEGEIEVKGENVSPKYLHAENNPEWFPTGDIGYLDTEGYLYVLDRRVDRIISGGENISPFEVESVLQEYPGIDEVVVVGKDDDQWGQVPVAFYVSKTELNLEEMIAYCQSRLAKYKIPKQFIRISEIPRNASGKVLRISLREKKIK